MEMRRGIVLALGQTVFLYSPADLFTCPNFNIFHSLLLRRNIIFLFIFFFFIYVTFYIIASILSLT